MNYSNIYFICPACNMDCTNAAHLNKHLNICLKYDEFIKQYKLNNISNCEKCNMKFINDKYLKEHKIICNK
jgi:hypothetical protein